MKLKNNHTLASFPQHILIKTEFNLAKTILIPRLDIVVTIALATQHQSIQVLFEF